MNFKALAATAAISLATFFGSAAPAEAKISKCWILRDSQQSTSPFLCEVNKRTNSNGHIVFDVSHMQGVGASFSALFWTDGTVEVFIDGDRMVTSYYEDSEGDVRIELYDSEFIIRF